LKRRLPLLATLFAIVGIVISPVSVFAASTGNTIVSGNVPATISLTATGTLNMPSLVAGTTVESSNINVTINTNTSGWSLTAAESGGGGDGKMDRTGGGTMTNALEIQGGNVTSYMPLSSTVVLRNANGTPGNIPFENIKFRQTVSATEAAGDYSIIVVFTISGGA
jgi:hypothetical protein